MLILQVDLENVKSYTSVSVPFTPGINAICGENGAGKSTLLEAIGFAVFGHAPFKPQDQIVREGERTATITVHVVGNDERVYHIVRRVGGTNQHYVYDPELDQKLADGVEESLAWLRNFAGVDETTDLDSLFADAVGVPQGKLTTVFTETAGYRKAVFDPLLRVDEYRNAWDRLREPRGWLEHRCHEYEKQTAALEAETKLLPQREVESAELLEAIGRAEARQSELEEDLRQAACRKASLDAVKARLEGLEQDVTRVVGEMQRAADRLAEAQKALARAEAAQAVVDEAAAGYDAYCAAEAELTDLDRQRDARDKVRAEQQRDEKRLAQIDEQLAGLARQLETIAEAEAAMVELRPRVEKQDGLEHALAEARHDAERLKSQQRALAEAEAGLAALSQRLSEVQMGVARRDQVQADLDQLRAALKPVDAEYEAVSQNLAALRADLGNLSDRQKQLAALVGLAERDLKQERERLTEWEQKRSKLQGETAHRPRLEAESETARCGLEELRERSDGLTETAARHRAELAHISTQLQALTSTETGQCPVCERELTPEHRDELLARQQARQEELNEALAAVQTEQQAVQQEMRKQEKALRTLDDRLKNLPRSDEVEAAVAQVTAHQTACDEREARLRDVQAEAAGLTTRMEMLGAELTEIETQQGELDRTRQAKQDEVDTLERELRELPSRADVESLMTQIEQQQAGMAEKTSSVEALSGAPEEVARREQALEALGDPRSEYRRQEGTAGRRVTVEREQGNAEDRKAQVEMALAAHSGALHMYDGLDDRVAEARDTRSAHEQDHQRYLEHIREAATLSERRDVVNIRSDGADVAVERHREVVAARDAVAAEFDADVYATLLEKHATLDRELAELQGRLGQQRQRQAVLEAEIAQLRETRSRLDKVRAEHVEHRELLTLLDHLREVLRSAGPEITKTLVGVISHQAEDLYMDIMHDYTARLRWTDDYDIELLAGGRTRTFQQLSGGEQMAAALAVRLALLREISAINIAFFDEPTANLDRDRRANLAAQILNVRGFAQLFVISHDDTFEQDTDSVIRVAKRNGASEIVA